MIRVHQKRRRGNYRFFQHSQSTDENQVQQQDKIQ